jgi:pyruvate dehydrogenase E2 component (dihydrolipoamide acetyltransferase)
MVGEFLMPSLGADMDAGTVTEWLVKVGDEVHRGDIVAVVDTDKADIDVEIFESGVIEELLVPEGVKVPVGTPLARLHAGWGSTRCAADTRPSADGSTARPHDRTAGLRDGTAGPPDGSGGGGALPCAPPAGGAPRCGSRRRARHGPRRPDHSRRHRGGGRATAIADARRRPCGRRAIGDLMARSSREIPHYYVATDIDASAAMDWLERTNAGRPVTERLLPAALLLKAAARAARERCRS